jgi:thiol-disulfide isomerase/thioredoxin
MFLKTIKNIIAVVGVTLSLHANSGWLDTLKQAKDLVKDTGVLDSASKSGSTSGSSIPGISVAIEYPFGLIEYPRATLIKETLNPFDRVNMPISPPVKLPSGETRARYEVPMEGKVTILQFEHKGDDSPILIQKHYEAWLTEKGFDRLLMCQSPCKEMYSYWDMREIIDPAKRILINGYPADPTYFTAFKNDAMVLVGVGKYQGAYLSIIKVVEGKVIDRTNWDKLKKPVTLPPSTGESKPVPELPGTTGVTAISADDALTYVKAAKGITYVQLSSYDKNCGYCVKANPEYDKFSIYHAGKAAFLQIAIQPWKDAFKNEFALTYNVTGVPTILAFENGKLIGRHNGLGSVKDLNKSLVK